MPAVLLLGATSSVARATAEEFASRGHEVVLAGRDLEELDASARDLEIRHGVRATVQPFDALDFASHEALAERWAGVDGVLLFFGYLGEQAVSQADFAEARRVLDVNFTACVSVLEAFARRFEARRSGFLCVLSSVAGDRGRQSNYIYGAAKGGLSAYLQGLRNRLFHAGVKVVTIKPGFLDTAMTYGKPGLFLVASPQQAAREIYRAVARGKDVAYVPGFWRLLMLVIRSIPEPVFKRLRL